MKNLKNALIIGSITILLLIILEILARLVYPAKVPEVRKDVAFAHDPVYQIRLKPHMSRQFVRHKENGGDTINWSTNSLGLRGPEPRQSEFRIAVYGDSNIQARFSKEEDTYVQKVAHYLTDIWQKDVEALNAGIIGFGPDQAYLKFQEEVDVLKPDLVILELFADNDYGDLLRNRLFELDAEGALKATGIPFEIDPTLMSGGDESSLRLFAIASRLNEKLFRKREQKNPCDDEKFKVDMLKTVQGWESGILEQYQKKGSKKYRFNADYYDFNLANYPDLASSKLKIALMRAVLRSFKDSAEEKGIDFMVIILPSVIDMTASNYFISKADIIEQNGSYDPRNLSLFMEQICGEEQIDFLNLYDPFLRNDPGSLYFGCFDNHWNDAGQDLAAVETTNFLVDKYVDIR